MQVSEVTLGKLEKEIFNKAFSSTHQKGMDMKKISN